MELTKPEIEITLPNRFIVGQTREFSIDIKANDYEDEIVNCYAGVSDPDGVISAEQLLRLEYTDEIWRDIPKDGLFGPETGFILWDINNIFRVTFNAPGRYPFTVKLISVKTGELLANKTVDVEVVANEIEHGTDYMEIYEQFLSAVTDDRYAVMSQEEIMVDLLPLLKRAIYYLCRIAKVPGFDLHNRDDINYRFMDKLTDHEIECLAWAMVVSWTEQQLNSSRLIEQQYYDAGIKTYSPNETMRNLLTLHEDYYKRLKNRLTEYGYKTVDISQFGGNE